GSREKKLFSIFKNINAGKNNSDEANTEKKSAVAGRIRRANELQLTASSSKIDSQSLTAAAGWQRHPERKSRDPAKLPVSFGNAIPRLTLGMTVLIASAPQRATAPAIFESRAERFRARYRCPPRR